MRARYLLCPGLVRSRNDGDLHNITARQLAHLYRVSTDECLVLPADRDLHNCIPYRGLALAS